MKLRVNLLAVLQIAFGTVVFSTNYWPAPMDTQMNAIYLYGIIAIVFGIIIGLRLRPALKPATSTTTLAILQVVLGAIIFSTNYWPAPMDTQMNAIYFYGIMEVIFGIATRLMLRTN